MASNRWTALNTFWNSFGLVAYDENTVPDGAVLPYITYEAAVASFDEKVPLTASLWYRSNSWADISEKAKQIEDYVSGGAGVPYMGGRLWITPEIPFAQRMSEPNDSQIRRILLQVIAEFQ